MRQWFEMVALGAVAALVVAVPGAAVGYEGDDAPNGATDRATEQVMERTQSRFGQPTDDESGTMERVQERNRLQLHDETGDNCPGACDGVTTRDRVQDRDRTCDGTDDKRVADCDGDRTRDRVRDRDQLRDGTGEACAAECDGDRLRDRDRLRQQLQDCEVGFRGVWQFIRRYGCAWHVAV